MEKKVKESTTTAYPPIDMVVGEEEDSLLGFPSPIETAINTCRRIQVDTDIEIQNLLNRYHNNIELIRDKAHSKPQQQEEEEQQINVQQIIDRKELLLEISNSFDKAINNYNSTITILNNIVNKEPDLYVRLKEFIDYSLLTKRQIIQTKTKMVEELHQKIIYDQYNNNDNQNNNNNNVEETISVILSILKVNLYTWKEGDSNVDQQVIGNTLGTGTLYLKKISNLLHSLELNLEKEKKEEENEQEQQLMNDSIIRFPVIKDSQIFKVTKGHYVLQDQEYFYGFVLPIDIPTVYIEVLENQLVSISTFNDLHIPIDILQLQSQQQVSLEKDNDNIETTTTTTTTTTSTSTTTTNNVSTVITKITASVDNGSQAISNGILAASTMISMALHGSGVYLKSNLNKHKDPVVVSPYISQSIRMVKSATPFATSSSSFIISKFSNLLGTVGGGVVEGAKYLANNTNVGNGTSNVEILSQDTKTSLGELGKTTIKAIAAITTAFSEGIDQIVEEASGTTIDVVHHKLGIHAAKVTGDTISIGKDVVTTAMTLGSVKSIALKCAVNGGGQIVQSQLPPSSTDSNNNNNENNKNSPLLSSSNEKEEESNINNNNNTSQNDNNTNDIPNNCIYYDLKPSYL